MSDNYDKIKNNSSDFLLITLSLGQTTMTLTDFSNLPSFYPYEVVIWDRATYEEPSDDPYMERVNITSLVSGNTVNITRAQSGTSQYNHAAGNSVTSILSTQELLDAHRNNSTIHQAAAQGLDVTDSPTFAGLTIGGETDYTEFETDGTIEFHGAATVWDDVRVAASNLTKAGNNDPEYTQYKTNGAGSLGVYTWSFVHTADKEVFF